MNLFNLTAMLTMNDSDFSERVERASNKMAQMGNKAKSVGASIDKFIKGALVAGGGALATFTALGVKNNAMLEQSKVAWGTLLGTQREAEDMLNRIAKFAATTPFSKMGVDTMAKQLHNAGFRGQEVFDQLTKIGDMGSAFGVQEESLSEMVRQYSQVQQAGVAYTEDLNILQDRGIPIYKALSETLGIAVADVKKLTSEGKVSAEVYNQALDSIAESTKGAMEAQSQTFNGLMSTVKDNITAIIMKASEPIFDKFKEGLESVAGIVEKVDFAVDIFLGSLDEGMSKSDAFFNAIEGAFGEEVAKKVQFLGDMVYYAVGALGAFRLALLGVQIATTVAGFFTKLTEAIALYRGGMTLATAVQTAFNLSVGLIPILIALAVSAVVVFAMIVIKNWDSIKAKTIELWTSFKNFVTNLKNSFVDKIKQIVESVVQYFKELPGRIKSALESFKNAVSDKMNQIKTSVVQYLKDIPKKVGEVFENAKKNIQNKLQEWGAVLTNFFTQTVPNAFSKMWEFINNIPYMIGFALSYAVSSVVKFIMDIWTYLSTAIPQLIESVGQWFAELPGKIWTWLVETKNKFVTWTTELSVKAQESFSALINSIVTWFSELPGKIWTWLVETKNKFVTWTTELSIKAQEAFSSLISSIVTWFSELPGKIWAWLVEAKNKFVTWTTELSQKAQEGMRNVVNTVVNTAKEIPGKMLEIGKWAVEGLWNGITSMGSWIKDKVKGFFNGIVDGVKAVFDTHSPSKVFEEIGVWNVQGLEVGMSKEIPKAERLVNTEMARVIPDKAEARGRMGGLQQGENGNNINITMNYTGKVQNEIELERKFRNDFRRLALEGMI